MNCIFYIIEIPHNIAIIDTIPTPLFEDVLVFHGCNALSGYAAFLARAHTCRPLPSGLSGSHSQHYASVCLPLRIACCWQRVPSDSHVLLVMWPVHEIMACEMTVAMKFNNGVRPMLVQVFHYSLHNTGHTERLVPAVWSQQWKHQLSCQSVEEQLTDAIECLILYVVLQAGCRGLGREVGIRWLTPAGHLQRTVVANTVTVVGILMAAEYLTYMLADHFHVSVVTNSFFYPRE